jgi:hypothetical protein
MGTERATKLAPAEFRGRVDDSIVETIGATPLVRIHRLAEDARTKAVLPDCGERYLSTALFDGV